MSEGRAYAAADTTVVIDYLKLHAKNEKLADEWLVELLGADLIPAIAATTLQEIAVSRDAPTVLPKLFEAFDVLDFDGPAALLAAQFQQVAQPPKLTKSAKGKWFRDGAIVGTCARHGAVRLVTIESAWDVYQPLFAQLSAGGGIVVVSPPSVG